MNTEQTPVREHTHRLPKEAYVGRVCVMFTLNVEGKRRTLTEADVVEPLIHLLAETMTKRRCTVPVFTFMPDHLHMLVRGGAEDSDTRSAVCSFTRKVGMRFPHVGFQKDLYDHIIKWFEGWENEVWYIANNPVRAGLIADPFAWPFTGSIGCDLREAFGR
jgi:putative transposase